jgi:hypothetical protein
LKSINYQKAKNNTHLKNMTEISAVFISMGKLLSGRGSMRRWYVVAAAPNWSLNLTTPKAGAVAPFLGLQVN